MSALSRQNNRKVGAFSKCLQCGRVFRSEKANKKHRKKSPACAK